MEFPDWPYTQSPNMTFYEQMYDQQQHSCGNLIQSSSNWYDPESNIQMTPSMADFPNPGDLDQGVPMQSPADLVMIEYDDNSNLSCWQNQDPGTQSPLFYIPGEATWENPGNPLLRIQGEATWENPENPLLHIQGEATWENPENPEFPVSNFIGQTNLFANHSQPTLSQFPNCIQNTENCLSLTTNSLEEYDGISATLPDHCKSVKSMSHNVNHSLEASEPKFNDIIGIESQLEETLSQISRETNPVASIVTTTNGHPGITNNSAGNHTHDSLVEFWNPEGGFHLGLEDHHPDLKESRLEKATQLSGTDFSEPSSSQNARMEEYDQAETMISPMKEMIYCAAALKPVNLDHEVVGKDQKPKRKNVRISSVPQTVAARQRRERINERLKVLQKLVPGGGKLDTASMLEEAANYLKFLKAQIKALENLGHKIDNSMTCLPMNLMFSPLPFYHSFPIGNNIFHYQLQNHTHYFHQPED